MLVYLDKFIRNNKVAFKLGKSKYGVKRVNEERYKDDQYKGFKIELLDSWWFSTKDPKDANIIANAFELCLHGVIGTKKSDYSLEEHFGDEKGSYGNFGGVTEFIVNKDEETILTIFKRAKKHMWKHMSLRKENE